jgi:hypothetical protein
MIEDLNNLTGTQVNSPQVDVKEKRQYSPSMKGNPNAVDTTPVADTYQSTPAGEVAPPDTPLKSVLYVVPTWLALNEGTKLFNKACGGEYEKSLVGRLGAFGDKVSGTKLVKNSFVDNIKTYSAGIRKRLQAFVDKHPMLSAMDKTPTKPECKMVTGFLETQHEADLKEAGEKINKFIEKTPKTLKEAGATKAEIDNLKAKYGTNIFGQIKDSEQAIKEFEFTKYAGANGEKLVTRYTTAIEKQITQLEAYYSTLPQGHPDCQAVANRIAELQGAKATCAERVLKRAKLRTLGLNNKTFSQIKTEPEKFAHIVERAAEKGRTTPLGKVFSQVANKLKSNSAPVSKLGKLLPKAAKLAMRGLTFGGGTFNTLFIAFMMKDTVKNAIEAPKEQKTGTIAHGLLEAMSWVVSMPLALNAMHKVSGLQYTGLSKGQVEAFRTAKQAFDAKAKAGGFASKADYDAAKKSVEALKNVAGQGKFTKAVKGFAKFIGIGLEQYNPYKEVASAGGKKGVSLALANIGRKVPNFLRNCVGYPLRFALYSFAFAPLVDKLFSGVTTAIFGKAYDGEKIREEQEKEKARLAELYSGPRMLPLEGADRMVGTTDLNTLSDKNLVKQKVLGVSGANTQTAPVYNPYQPTIQGQTTPSYNEPFLPPFQQGGQTQGTGMTQQNDPNKSEYDTVPRSYIPQIDFNNPVPYGDPMANPNAEKNYDSAQKLADKMDKLANDVEKFL